MANTKVSAMTAAGALTGTELFYVTDSGGTIDRKATATQIKTFVQTATGGVAFTQGSIIFAGASGVLSEDNDNLFWDDTNNRLGIGTATPSKTLDIAGNANSQVISRVINTNAGTSARAAFEVTNDAANIFDLGIEPLAAGGGAYLYSDATSIKLYTSDSAQPIILSPAFSDTFTVKDGKTGIGTTTPGYLLDIQANVSGNVDAIVAHNASAGATATSFIGASNDLGYFVKLGEISSVYASNPRFGGTSFILSNTNLGILALDDFNSSQADVLTFLGNVGVQISSGLTSRNHGIPMATFGTINDDIVTPRVAYAGFFQTIVKAGAAVGAASFGYELSVKNENAAVAADPFNFTPSQVTYGVRISSGIGDGVGTPHDNSGAINISSVSEKWLTGINIGSNALATDAGLTHPPAISMPSGANGHAFTWYRQTGFTTPAWQIYSSSTTTDGNTLDLQDAAAVFKTPVNSGIAGTSLGTYNLSGNTSGTISIKPQAAAGTYNFNLPTTAGSSGEVLTSAAGGSSPMTWTAQASLAPTENFTVAASDETTALTTGTAKVTFRMPYAFTVTGIRASLSTAQTSGSIFTVDVNETGTSIISTKITIDNTEKTSTTAATPPVISDTALADDAEITVDIDQVGDGTAKGLKVYLIGHR